MKKKPSPPPPQVAQGPAPDLVEELQDDYVVHTVQFDKGVGPDLITVATERTHDIWLTSSGVALCDKELKKRVIYVPWSNIRWWA